MAKPMALAPLDPPSLASNTLPKGAVDAHFHMVGSDYPLWPGRVENPAEGTLDDWLARFRRHLATLGFEKGVVVHSILYGDDNSVTCDAIQALGDGFCGVGLVRDGATEQELRPLADRGIRAVRLNYVHGSMLSWEGAKAMAPHLAACGMHIEMLLHSHLHMQEIADDLQNLPVPVVIDHCGWPELGLGLETQGQKKLEALLGDGKLWIKLSARYRFESDKSDLAKTLQARLASINPDRCVWGTDWPHLMLGGVAQPDAGRLLSDFLDAVPSQDARERILARSPTTLYQI